AEVGIAIDDHVGAADGLGNPNTGLHLLESAPVAETVASGANNDMEPRPLLLHPELLSQGQGLGTDTDGIFVVSAQHIEAALVREREYPGTRRRPAGTGLERLGDVTVRR